jgi:hypothetical protein
MRKEHMMSAWGSGSFENDDALDWVYKLKRYDNLDLIVSTLERGATNDLVIYGDHYVDMETVQIGLAAAEVVAALRGHPSGALPRAITEWIESHGLHVHSNITALAIQVVTRALQTQELRDLWAEAIYYDEWKSVVEDLQLRLSM